MNTQALPAPFGWPSERRVVRNHTLDSRMWDSFSFRDDDIVISTWAKAGTSWMQQIVAQLIFAGDPDVRAMELSPWIEQRGPPAAGALARLEAQAHRRFVKTHLSPDALPYSARVRYIYVARDGRDVLWSWYNHHCQLSPVAYAILNRIPDRVGPPLLPAEPDVRAYFRRWIERDGYPLWPFWAHVQSWWDARELPNVLLVHFNDLRADLPAELHRIARFLGISVSEASWPRIVHHCSFEFMKTNAARLASSFEGIFSGGATRFIHRGTGEQWKDTLTAEDVRLYEEAAKAHLCSPCRAWLAGCRT